MVEFTIEKSKLDLLLKTCSMKGAIQFRDGKVIKKPFFSSFYIDVNPEGRLEVLALDTVRKKTLLNVILNDVDVEEDGILPITDFEGILLCLKGNGIEGEIKVTDKKGGIILLKTSDDWYEIRQRDNPDIKQMQKKNIVKALANWKKTHVFDSDYKGLVMKHPKEGDIPYPMWIELDKKNFLKVIGDTLNITKDNTTRLIFEDGKLEGLKGSENSRHKSGHKIDFIDKGEEFIEFDESFYSLQTIIPNLFDKINFHIRRAKQKNTINIFIKSSDEKNGIEVLMGITSIVKKK